MLCPPALSYDSEIINVDGDRAAAVVAVACKAETLILLSNVPGLLRDLDDADSLVRCVERDQLDAAMDIAQGRMKKKVMGAREAPGRRRRHGYPGRRSLETAYSPGDTGLRHGITLKGIGMGPGAGT